MAGSIKSSPIARPDSYNAIGNTLLTVATASGVLANDSDPDGDSVSVSSFSPTSAHGGAVTMAGDGSFTYLSAAGYTGADTFTYTISDGHSGTSSSVVTLLVSNTVWYVNNAGANGDGRQTSPFNSLAGAAAASATNNFIYVFQGSGNYTAGIALKNGQNLVGSGDALVVAGTTIYAAGTRPTILTGFSSGTGVSLASNNNVHGINVGASSGRAFSGGAVGNLVISNVIATATGGASVVLTNGTVNVTLDSATSSGSTDNGIALNAINGSLVINGGSIGTAAGTDFVVAGGNGTVTYAGSINNAAGRSVDISGRTGGTVTLSGNITDTATGIIVQNNTGGTTVFSGSSKSLSTGANPAVTLASNTGHTINFSNGGLAITTTTATGFNATGGGTVTVTTGVSANAIGSSTGTALNVVNTTIGASGLTFLNISAPTSSANAGIILDGTGASGGLTVTGAGTAGSGGTIANKTGVDILTGTDAGGQTTSGTGGVGIFLRNTINPSFSYMQLNNFSNFGIYGNNVTGFILVNSIINGSNGSNNAGNREEDSIRFDNLVGTCSITGSSISGGYTQNLDLYNTSGTLTRLTINTNTFGLVNTTGGNDNVLLQAYNSATANLTLTNNIFLGTKSDFFAALANNNSTLGVIARNNTFHNGQAIVPGGGTGVDVRGDTAGAAVTVAFDISHNTLTDGGANAFDTVGIFVAKGNGSGTMVGTIQANTVGPAKANANADGIFVRSAGSGTVTVLINNNIITGNGDNGIHLQNNDGSSTMNASVFGNTESNANNQNFAGFFSDNGATASDTSTMNLVVGSATDLTKQNTFVMGVNGAVQVEISNINNSTHSNLYKNGSASGTIAGVIQDDNVGTPTVDTTGGNGVTALITSGLPPAPPAVAP